MFTKDNAHRSEIGGIENFSWPDAWEFKFKEQIAKSLEMECAKAAVWAANNFEIELTSGGICLFTGSEKGKSDTYTSAFNFKLQEMMAAYLDEYSSEEEDMEAMEAMFVSCLEMIRAKRKNG